MFDNQEIMITGGTGSLGTTLLRKLLTDHKPKGIRVFSRDEFKQWQLFNQLEREFPDAPVSFLIGDVRDAERVNRAMHGVDILINTAAMKQVPACEYNPMEAIKTNIHGAMNIIDAAIDNRVSKVLHISTDKAVYPVNLYGATKAVTEKLFLHANVYSPNGTIFSCCRYGNVIASRGSIIPLIKEQYEKTGCVTLTHEDMTRFFIPLPKVADFIIDKLNIMKGQEIFIPKMPSVYIRDLINTITPKATMMITGIRQGEKLHEVLITEEESEYTITNDYYYKVTHDKQSDKRWTYCSNNSESLMTNQELILAYMGESV